MAMVGLHSNIGPVHATFYKARETPSVTFLHHHSFDYLLDNSLVAVVALGSLADDDKVELEAAPEVSLDIEEQNGHSDHNWCTKHQSSDSRTLS